MTDNELLKLAAKSVGLKISFHPDGQCRDTTGLDPSMNVFAAKNWNPLENDSDAFQLLVKLGMSIDTNYCGDSVCVFIDGDEVVVIRHKGDPRVATRRVIVQAAAKIGKGIIHTSKHEATC